MITLVYVNQDDITLGRRGHCSLCPVALGLKRVIPSTHTCSVGTTGARLMAPDGKTDLVRLPASVTKFITAFDSEYPVEPFSFEVDLPC
jgi:hypothetical protein